MGTSTAECAERAISAADVALAQGGIFERAFTRRDYRPKALMRPIKIGVIGLNDDGNLYICGQDLAKTIWRDL